MRVAIGGRRPNANPNVRAWWASVDETQVFLSVPMIGEARRGIERLRRRDPAQAAVLDEWLARLRQHAADRILPITSEMTPIPFAIGEEFSNKWEFAHPAQH